MCNLFFEIGSFLCQVYKLNGVLNMPCFHVSALVLGEIFDEQLVEI